MHTKKIEIQSTQIQRNVPCDKSYTKTTGKTNGFFVQASPFERSNERRSSRLRGSDGLREGDASQCEWPINEERRKQG